MKFKLLFTLLISLSLATTAIAAEPGDITFGSQDSPDLVLGVSDPGYDQFVNEVAQNTDWGTMTVDWNAVNSAISSNSDLTDVSDWLNSNPDPVGLVFVRCGYMGNGYYCYVAVPYSCDNCPESVPHEGPW